MNKLGMIVSLIGLVSSIIYLQRIYIILFCITGLLFFVNWNVS